MWLDELNDLVVKLNTKIDQHREILRKSESATRYGLIDPLLTALGWDLSDPAQVLTEYNSGNGRADYAMVPGNGPPSLVVEAKSLFTPTAQGIAQSINYCLQDGIKYFVVTNGDDWEVYETHRPVPMQEKRVTAFKITDMNQSTVIGMLWLWRGNFKVGDPAMPAPPPPAEELPTTPSVSVAPPAKPTPPLAVSPSHQGGSNGAPTTSLDHVPPGVPLSELNPSSGNNPPQFMTFPGGTRKPLGKWNRIQVVTVEWLAETGRLKELDCPLTGPHGNYLVHTTPYKRNGTLINKRRQVNQYWIDLNYTAVRQIRRAILILNAVGVDPATVFVSSSAQASTSSSQPYPSSPATSPPRRAVSKAAPVSAGVPLSELDPGKGQPPPQFMTFPGGTRKPLGKWNRIQVVTVEWLIETGKLNESDCPLTNPRGTHLVHMSPHGQDGKRFWGPKAIKQYWIDVSHSAEGQARRARDILNATSVDPATICVSS